MNLSQLDLKLLMVFVDVVEARSFTAAAQLRESDVGYISRQIKRLEKELGSVLFNRSTRSLSLTNLGNRTYQDACKIRNISNRIVESARSEKEVIQGLVRITSGAFLGRNYIFSVLERVSNRHPALTIELELDEDKVDIIKKRFDLSVRVWKPKDTNLVAQKLCNFGFLLAATPEFIREHGTPRSLSDLDSLPSVLYARNEHSNKQFSFYDEQGVIRTYHLSSNLLVSDAELIVRTVLGGKRYGLFPSFMVENELKSGKLVQLLPQIKLVSDEGIYLVYPTKSKTKAIEMIIDELKREISFNWDFYFE
ncbi:LysR family transcriptional regulator [Vibrio alfacsensis]|uniref:LysR family transcriptional regulator n=1 Tax=Vibrio alfacsensis TaxID=1074311 RepID=UPI0040689606